jgi:hypothetical protein
MVRDLFLLRVPAIFGGNTLSATLVGAPVQPRRGPEGRRPNGRGVTAATRQPPRFARRGWRVWPRASIATYSSILRARVPARFTVPMRNRMA